MADQVPPLGHLPRIFERMFAENDSIPKSCVEVVNVLSGSGVSEGGREGGGWCLWLSETESKTQKSRKLFCYL